MIDGVDISKIGLEVLRSNLSIIPQDPTIFSGTIRSNLDPFEQYDDEELWRVLERVHIKQKIQSLPDLLYTRVAESKSYLLILFIVAKHVLIGILIRRRKFQSWRATVALFGTCVVSQKQDHLNGRSYSSD